MAVKQYNIKLETETHKRLKILAAKKEITISELANKILARALSK